MYTVLITCVGGEMAPFMIQTLKESKRHEVKIVGVDADHSAIGKYFCDDFVTVPYGGDIGYANSIKEIVNIYSVDLIIPTSDEEAMALSLLKSDFEKQGCVLACIDANILSILIDKAKTYKFLRKFNIHTPKTIIIDQFHDLIIYLFYSFKYVIYFTKNQWKFVLVYIIFSKDYISIV